MPNNFCNWSCQEAIAMSLHKSITIVHNFLDRIQQVKFSREQWFLVQLKTFWSCLKQFQKHLDEFKIVFGPLEVQGIWEVTANKSGVILMDVRNYLEVEKTGKLFTVPTKTRWKFIPEANQIKNERTFSSQAQKLQKMLSAEWISPSFKAK